jgi:hypothetical protein
MHTGNAQTYEVVETLPPLSGKCAGIWKTMPIFLGVRIRKERIIPVHARRDYRGRGVIAP